MLEYLSVLESLVKHGQFSTDRTGTGTYSLFSQHLHFPIYPRFPLLTTKKVFWKGVKHELFWFLSGSTNIKYLQDNNIKIWDDWADVDGEVGPMYGYLWRKWPDPCDIEIDQLQTVIDNVRSNPFSRRHVISAWNPAMQASQNLPPCHILFQFYIRDGRISCHLTQRSGDFFLGVPFNIASYSLLTYMVAKVTGLIPHEMSYTIVDCHLYKNHLEQAEEQLSRKPRLLPQLEIITDAKEIDEIKIDEIHLNDYHPHPAIKAPVSV